MKIFYFVILIYVIFTPVIYSQEDSTKHQDKKLMLIPGLHSIQIDAASLILMNQLGVELDLDVLRTTIKNTSIGIRIGVEHNYLNNFVEKIVSSPFTNYNLYTRLSGEKNDFNINVLAGVTYYVTDKPNILPGKYLFRTGFEIKYGGYFGFLLKGSTSLIKNSSFIGIGIYLGYNHN